MSLRRFRFHFISVSLLLTLTVGNFVSAAVGWGVFAKARQAQGRTAAVAVATLKPTVAKASFDLGFAASRDGQTLTLGELTVVLPPKAIVTPTRLELAGLNWTSTLPWNLTQVSPVYQLDFAVDAAYNPAIPLTVKLAYQLDSKDFKQIFYYDAGADAWQPLASQELWPQKIVQAELNRPFAQIAVFSHPKVLASGKASWYAYKGGDFAASPDFPRDSVVQVTNSANGKTLTVTINDWGPERSKHPDRVIDLDKVAFAKLADLGEGVIDVVVQPLKIAADSQGRVLGIKASGMSSQPTVAARSAVIMDEERVLYAKAANTILPIASLSKVAAMAVFLQTKPNFFQTVTYRYADEKLNYQYCEPWESAKVYLKEGDEVQVRDLFYSTLIGSTNNAVETLVRVSGLSRPEFVRQMNDLVQTWGALDTHFVEPTGLSPDNVSTAQDYALIMREAFKNDLIAQASVMAKYEFTTQNTKVKHTVKNTNQSLLNAQPSIVGSKTGYLHEAGFCLATKVAAQKTFYIVTFGSPNRATSFAEMQDLIAYVKKL